MEMREKMLTQQYFAAQQVALLGVQHVGIIKRVLAALSNVTEGYPPAQERAIAAGAAQVCAAKPGSCSAHLQ